MLTTAHSGRVTGQSGLSTCTSNTQRGFPYRRKETSSIGGGEDAGVDAGDLGTE